MTDDDPDNPDQRPAIEREIDRADDTATRQLAAEQNERDELARTAGELSRAIATAARVHNFQVDKAGEPYICHVLRVMDRAAFNASNDALNNTPRQLQKIRLAALYHDAVEDGDGSVVSLEWLYNAYGDDVGDAVDALTHRPGEPWRRYLDRCRANPIAFIVKQADMLDNKNPERLRKLPAVERERLEIKYADGWNYLIYGITERL